MTDATTWRTEAVPGRRVATATALGGALCGSVVVVWVVAVGERAGGLAALIAIIGLVVGTTSCALGHHAGSAVPAAAFASALLVALIGSDGGVRLDAGPVAVLAVAAIELWGWSLDHRADAVTLAVVVSRATTLTTVLVVGAIASVAVVVIASVGSGAIVLRAVAVVAIVGALAGLVRFSISR